MKTIAYIFVFAVLGALLINGLLVVWDCQDSGGTPVRGFFKWECLRSCK